MIGLLQSIGHGLENFGLAVEGAFLEAECAVKNAAIDIKTDAKVRKYQRERLAAGYSLDDDEEDIEEFEEEDKEKIIDVYCPKCGEKRTIAPNTDFTCKECGVRISLGDDGEIRCSFSAEK